MNNQGLVTSSKSDVQQLFFCGAVFLSFGILKWWYQSADVSDVDFLLKPVSRLIGWITSIDSVYLESKGYMLLTPSVLIDKSCSGFNFWMITSISLLMISWPYIREMKYHFLVFPAAYFVAYIATLMINTSRIIIAILMKVLMIEVPSSLHRVEGIVVYLTGLIIVVLICRWILNGFVKKNIE